MVALKALNSYISPESDHLPFIAVTGVLLLETDYIT
jgi:hypothetical protein